MLDVSGSYPNGEIALNTSKETTVREPMNIEGVPEEVWRYENMGISAGHVNAYAWCQNILNFPSHEEILVEFIKDTGLPLKVSYEQCLLEMHGPEFAPMYKVPEGLAS